MTTPAGITGSRPPVLTTGRVPLTFEAPRDRAGEESDSVKDFLIAWIAYPAAEPTGNALTGIH